jgi:hypothetical protein
MGPIPRPTLAAVLVAALAAPAALAGTSAVPDATDDAPPGAAELHGAALTTDRTRATFDLSFTALPTAGAPRPVIEVDRDGDGLRDLLVGAPGGRAPGVYAARAGLRLTRLGDARWLVTGTDRRAWRVADKRLLAVRGRVSPDAAGLVIRWRALTFRPDGRRGDLAPDRGYRRGVA